MPNVPKSAPDIDPHRDAVYRWEDSWADWNRNTGTAKACRTLIRKACEHYRVPAPTVVVHPQRTFSWSIPRLSRISIQGGRHRERGGRNAATALHEAAHHIAYHLHGERIQDHGPTFLGIYLDLLARTKVAPRIALETTARKHGLRWRRSEKI